MPKAHKLLLFIAYFCVLTCVLAVTSRPAFAHGAGGGDHQAQEMEAIADMWLKAIELEAVIYPEDLNAARLDENWKQNQALIESGAYRMMLGLVRQYNQAAHDEGCDAGGIDEAAFTGELITGPARGGLMNRLHQKLIQEVGEISHESFDVGARLGRQALILKLLFEGVETIGSKAMGGMGMHFFCTAADGAILFGMRHVQLATRTVAWAPQFDQNRVMALMRTSMAHRRARKVFRRTKLIMGPIELDPEEVKEIDSEGKKRWWGIVKDGKRATFLEKIEAQTARGKPVKYAANFKQFYGRRWLYVVKSRKRSKNYLAGNTAMDNLLKDKELVWIFSLQEGLINRANTLVNRKPIDFGEENLTPLSPVAKGLVAEATAKFNFSYAHQEGLGLLLNDLDFIFDPTKDTTSREVRTGALETYFSVLTLNLLHGKWISQGKTDVNTWAEVWSSSVDRNKEGHFASLAYEFADFLTVASTSSDPMELTTNKYAAQNFLVQLYYHMQILKDLQLGITSKQDLQLSRIRVLNARPWGPRDVAREGWVPYRTRMPLCENL